MLTEIAGRLNNVRIPRHLTPLGANQYEICAHWWSWWLPHNPNLIWDFLDQNNNIIQATSTYTTNPVIIQTSTPITNLFVYVPIIPVRIIYFSEFNDKLANVERPTLFILSETDVSWNSLDYVTTAFQAIFVIPTKANIDAAFWQQIHAGMLSCLREYFNRALVNVEKAEFSHYGAGNRQVGRAGNAAFSVSATYLVMTLSFTHYL